jgi:hypothetical protein
MLHPNLILKNHRLLSDLNLFLAVFAEHQCSAEHSSGNAGLEVWVVCVCVCMWCVQAAMCLRSAVDSNVLITLDTYNTLYQEQAWRGYIRKKQDRFLSEYFGFPLSVSFQQCYILIFIYMLLLPDGRTGEAREPSKEQCSYGNRSALDRKVLSL